jgi:hypothetical protein
MGKHKGSIPLADLAMRGSYGWAIGQQVECAEYNLHKYGHTFNPGEGPASEAAFLEADHFAEKRELIAKAARKRKQAEKAARRIREGRPVGPGCVPVRAEIAKQYEPVERPSKWTTQRNGQGGSGKALALGDRPKGWVSSYVNGSKVI